MLAIRESTNTRKVTPNLLPCAVKHNGPITVADRYWNPEAAKDSSYTAYFRGRKLCGRQIELPANYQGVILEKTENNVPQKPIKVQVPVEDEDEEEMEDEDEDMTEVKMMEPQGKFDKFFVWGHESIPEADHQHVKGIEEWIALAEKIHSNNTSEKS